MRNHNIFFFTVFYGIKSESVCCVREETAYLSKTEENIYTCNNYAHTHASLYGVIASIILFVQLFFFSGDTHKYRQYDVYGVQQLRQQ